VESRQSGIGVIYNKENILKEYIGAEVFYIESESRIREDL
jgi:hypothetical protein